MKYVIHVQAFYNSLKKCCSVHASESARERGRERENDGERGGERERGREGGLEVMYIHTYACWLLFF